MQRKPRTHAKRATALTNAKPEFVSIVKTGANMTPFRTMKSEDQPENTMQLKTKAATHDIARLVFKGEAFTEEAAVVAWLEAGGYEGLTVVKGEDGSFSVTDPDAPTEGLVEVETDGVTAYVFQKAASVAKDAAIAAEAPTPEGLPSVVTTEGVQPVAKAEGENEPAAVAAEPAVAADPAVAVEPAAKTEATAPILVVGAGEADAALFAELTQKFDSWEVEYSDELSLGDALADGFDGVPPGFGEVITAMYVATRNSIIMGQAANLPTIFADAAKVIQKLAAIFPADVPLAIDPTVFLEAEGLSAYAVKAEDGTVTLDEVKLRGDLFFPELTLAAAPLVLAAQKATAEDIEARKVDMTHKRKRISDKAAVKAKPNAQDDGSASDATADGSNGGASGAAKSKKKETSETGSAAPEVAGDALTAALTAALAPALKAMTDLTLTMQASAQKTQDDAAAQIAQVKKETAEAIEAVKAAQVERQTRKAAEADECDSGNTVAPQSSKQQQATKSVADMRLRGALGMPRPNR